MKELMLEATIENIERVTAFIDEQLEAVDCPRKAQMQINVAMDELLSNIAQYAYKENGGMVIVQLDIQRGKETIPCAQITLMDCGIPYDPLKMEDPDVTLSLEERPEGGLGIFMAKKLMDHISYEYREGRNILTVTKRLERGN